MKLMTHVYAGDPGIDFSEKLLKTLDSERVDFLELGIPFADPVADGTVFQEACQRALKNGTTPVDVFNLVERLNNTSLNSPVVITTYYNIIFQYGLKKFCTKLRQLKIYGLIVPDLPYEESYELYSACRENDIHLIYVIMPTTTGERLEKIISRTSGFVYLTAFSGVTGSSKESSEEIGQIAANIRKLKNIDIFLGFGISKPEHIEKYHNIVDGVVIGSEICRKYREEDNDDKKINNVKKYLDVLKKVL